MTKIRFENVSTVETKSGSRLKNVDLEIDDGEYVAVLGPTGAGPSELLQATAGMLALESGRIYFDDVDVTDLPPEDRHIGMVFEQFNLFPHLTVLDNLLYGPRMRREDIGKKTKVAGEVISMVRLDDREDAISRELSGGMQQRTGVARAIVAGAKILLLDQPYRALDAKIRAEMRLEIRNIVKGLNVSCLHSTHETEEAMLVADKIAVFNEGRLEQFDTPEVIFKYPKSEFVASFLAESNIWDIQMVNGRAKINDTITFDYDPGEYSQSSYTRMVVKQHAIDLFFEESKLPGDWNKVYGKITRVRLLGDFIRITVQADGIDFIVREIVNPDLRDPFALIGKEIWFGFARKEVNLF